MLNKWPGMIDLFIAGELLVLVCSDLDIEVPHCLACSISTAGFDRSKGKNTIDTACEVHARGEFGELELGCLIVVTQDRSRLAGELIGGHESGRHCEHTTVECCDFLTCFTVATKAVDNDLRQCMSCGTTRGFINRATCV